MCGGGSDKQRPSAHDIALAQQAGRKDIRFEQAFMPLEIFEIEQFRDPQMQKINRDIIAGRVNADTAMAEKMNHQAAVQAAQASGAGFGSANNAAALQQAEMGTALGLSAGRTEADRLARNIRDAEGMSIARTGQNISRGNTENLAGMARRENFMASSRLQDQIMTNTARARALGDVASAAVIGGHDAFKQAGNPVKAGNRDGVADADLSLGARMLRGLGVGGGLGQGNFRPVPSATPELTLRGPSVRIA